MIILHNIEETQTEHDKRCLFVQFKDTNVSKEQYNFLKNAVKEYNPDDVYGIEIDSPEVVFDKYSGDLSVWIRTIITNHKTHDNFNIAANKLTKEFIEEFPKFYEDLKQRFE